MRTRYILLPIQSQPTQLEAEYIETRRSSQSSDRKLLDTILKYSFYREEFDATRLNLRRMVDQKNDERWFTSGEITQDAGRSSILLILRWLL